MLLPSIGAAIGIAILTVACGGRDTPPPTPPPSAPTLTTPATPTLEPTRSAPDDATLAHILLQEARDLEHNGFWEAALAERSGLLGGRLARALPPADRQAAHLEQARLLLRLDRPGDALVLLERLSGESLPADGHAARLLLHGRAATAVGETASAIAAFTAYLQAGGAAAAAVRLERARLFTTANDGAAAEADYRTVVADPATVAYDREAALLELGLLLENQGRYAEAAAEYQALTTVSPWVSDDAFALHRGGIVAEALGDTAAALDAWRTLVRDFPWHWRAVEAYNLLLAHAARPDPASEGRFLYHQGRDADARDHFIDLLETSARSDEQALALFYLAALDERAGNIDAAVSGYLSAAGRDSRGLLADDALWWAARLLENQGFLAFPGVLYDRLAREHPDSAFAEDAWIRAGITAYRGQNYREAADRFAAAAAALDGAGRQRALAWTGKALAAGADQPGAVAVLIRAVAENPAAYYGLRAQAILGGDLYAPHLQAGPLPAATDPAQSSADLDAWLAARVGPESADASPLTPDPRWRAARDLLAAGRQADTDRLILALLHDQQGNPWPLLRLAQALDALDRPHLRLEAAVALLDAVAATVPARLQAPRLLLEWAYPKPWEVLVDREAAAFHVDPLLLYALMRQESRFNPDAGSGAGALGLTQVIEPTGEEIAGRLADPDFAPDRLFRPERAIRYGAFYFADQLDAFDGAPWMALAAYNGGPGNAFRWALGDTAIDPDLFYEQVTFTETRDYLRLVLENYAWYRYLYQGGNAPSLLPPAAT